MKFSALIGKSLKDPEVIEILDFNDIEVIYDFDRHFENMGDVYWASCEVGGYQFRFNSDQVLDTIFLYVTAHDGFNAIDLSSVDVANFESFDSAEDYYKENAINYVTSPGELGSDTHKWWIKCELENIKIHHQFKQGKTNKITIMSHDA